MNSATNVCIYLNYYLGVGWIRRKENLLDIPENLQNKWHILRDILRKVLKTYLSLFGLVLLRRVLNILYSLFVNLSREELLHSRSVLHCNKPGLANSTNFFHLAFSWYRIGRDTFLSHSYCRPYLVTLGTTEYHGQNLVPLCLVQGHPSILKKGNLETFISEQTCAVRALEVSSRRQRLYRHFPEAHIGLVHVSVRVHLLDAANITPVLCSTFFKYLLRIENETVINIQGLSLDRNSKGIPVDIISTRMLACCPPRGRNSLARSLRNKTIHRNYDISAKVLALEAFRKIKTFVIIDIF